MAQQKLLVFGSGGHAKVIVDAIEAQNKYKIAGIVTKDPISTFCGYKVLKQIPKGSFLAIVAIGDNSLREKVSHQIIQSNPTIKFATVIHPNCVVSKSAKIGEGTVVLAASIINAYAKVGAHVILNTGSIIEHDCQIDNFASIAPGAILGGGSVVGARSAISIGTICLHGIVIGKDSVIGAGSVVTRNQPSGVVAFGSPCKKMRKRNKQDRYL